MRARNFSVGYENRKDFLIQIRETKESLCKCMAGQGKAGQWGIVIGWRMLPHPSPNPWNLWMLPLEENKNLRWEITWVGPKCNHSGRRKKTMCPQRQGLEWCGHKPTNAGCHQKLEKARNGFFSGLSRGSLAWLMRQWDLKTELWESILVLSCSLCGDTLQQL